MAPMISLFLVIFVLFFNTSTTLSSSELTVAAPAPRPPASPAHLYNSAKNSSRLPSHGSQQHNHHRQFQHQHHHHHQQRHITRNITGSSYLDRACSLTRYQKVCLRTLRPFARAATGSPTTWARAGVSVAVGEVKSLVRFLNSLKTYGGGGGATTVRRRRRQAIFVCIETVQDALDGLHQSLGVLRNIGKGRSPRVFDEEMSDVLTWLSAALTDEDTCADGFRRRQQQQRREEEEKDGDIHQKVGGNSVRIVRRKVRRATYVTSNALALVNNLAAHGY